MPPKKKLSQKQDRLINKGHPMAMHEAWEILKNDSRKIFPPLLFRDDGEGYTVLFEEKSNDDKETKEIKLALDTFCCVAYQKMYRDKKMNMGQLMGNTLNIEGEELSFTFIRIGFEGDTTTTAIETAKKFYFYIQIQKL